MEKTTQEIYNKIQEIMKEGNWIESPYRYITWIPTGKIEHIIDRAEKEITEGNGYDHRDSNGWNERIAFIKKELGLK